MLRRGLLKGLAGLTAAGVAGEKILPKTGLQTAADVPKMTAEHLAAPEMAARAAPTNPAARTFLTGDIHRALDHLDVENGGADADLDSAYGALYKHHGAHPHISEFLDDMDEAAENGGEMAYHPSYYADGLDRAVLDLDPAHHAQMHGGIQGQWYDSPAHNSLGFGKDRNSISPDFTAKDDKAVDDMVLPQNVLDNLAAQRKFLTGK